MTTGSGGRKPLTAEQYHEVKLLILFGKCDTHREEDPCNSVCAALDEAIARVWRFSEMAEKARPS